MDYRLLVDLEAMAVLDSIPKRVRKSLLDHFVRMREMPDRYSDLATDENINLRKIDEH